MDSAFMRILIASLLIESVWETIRIIIFAAEKKEIDEVIGKIGALVVSIVVCLNYRIDLLATLGFMDHIPFLGTILTGILVSRGSNFVHQLLNNLQKNAPKLTIMNNIPPNVIHKNEDLKESTIGKE